MEDSPLAPRIAIQLGLALASRIGADKQNALEARARRLGLTGAEIDAARDGRCFEVRAAAAVALALAVEQADACKVVVARERAAHLGLSPGDLRWIEAAAG